MSDQIVSNIVTLVAVALGWLLGEATGLIKSWRKTSSIRRALTAELEDMLQWASDVEITVINMARKLARKETPNDILVKIAHPVFSEHFPQVCIDLTTAERLSFIAIHRLVDALHSQYEKLAEARLRAETHWRTGTEFTHLLRDMYVNARFVTYRISWHLERMKRAPDELFLHEGTQQLMEQFQDDFQKTLKE